MTTKKELTIDEKGEGLHYGLCHGTGKVPTKTEVEPKKESRYKCYDCLWYDEWSVCERCKDSNMWQSKKKEPTPAPEQESGEVLKETLKDEVSKLLRERFLNYTKYTKKEHALAVYILTAINSIATYETRERD